MARSGLSRCTKCRTLPWTMEALGEQEARWKERTKAVLQVWAGMKRARACKAIHGISLHNLKEKRKMRGCTFPRQGDEKVHSQLIPKSREWELDLTISTWQLIWLKKCRKKTRQMMEWNSGTVWWWLTGQVRLVPKFRFQKLKRCHFGDFEVKSWKSEMMGIWDLQNGIEAKMRKMLQ